MYYKNNCIELEEIVKNSGKVEFHYSVSDGVSQFFSNNPFWIEYPENIESVSEAILAIPFVCNVLPLVWLSDLELIIPELDEDFYNCVPNVKKGYIDMYPNVEFGGKITVRRLVRNVPEHAGRSATLFSGGLDSWCTLVRHIDETPDLISIWGSDIKVDNIEGWKVLYRKLEDSSKKIDLNLIPIKSTFRQFIVEKRLDEQFYPLLQDGWWHGVQHGIGLIAHTAPINFLRGVTVQYIAASFSPGDGNLTCASWPSIDNNVRFASCRVSHDAFITRQEKIKILVEYCKRTEKKADLHVCWQTDTGENCCRCEKCCRTIIGLLVEGVDPIDYGFNGKRINYQYISDYILYYLRFDQVSKAYWRQIQSAYQENKNVLSKTVLRNAGWLEQLDVNRTNEIYIPIIVRLRHEKGIRGILSEFKFYQNLRKLKSIFNMSFRNNQ